jgi:hypothetical protein
MEYLEGETLAARVRSGGALRTAELVPIGIELCRALQYAHDHGVLHRDLKPANIMLTPQGVKLLDFGIASLIDSRELRPPVTPSSLISGDTLPITADANRVGTAQYMSPEQVRGEPLDARTDVFSLGVVLYEMATAATPFQGETSAEVLEAVLHNRPSTIADREIPRGLQDVIFKCLAKARELRFLSALATEAALRTIADKPGVEPAKPASAPSAALRRTTTRLWAAAALIAIIVCVPVYQHFDVRSAMNARYTQAAALTWARDTANRFGCSTDGLKSHVSVAPAFEMDEVLATEGYAAARRAIKSGYSFAWQIDFGPDASLPRIADPGCSVLLDMSGQLLEYRSHSASRPAIPTNQTLKDRVTKLAQEFLHLAPNDTPDLGVGEWTRRGIIPGWREHFSVSVTEAGQVLRLSRLFLRGRSSHVGKDYERAATMFDNSKAILALGLYCYGLFILVSRWRFLVLPRRVPIFLATSPALAVMWLILAASFQSPLYADHSVIPIGSAITAGLIAFGVTLPALAGLFASLRHNDHARTVGFEDLLRARISDTTVTHIADGVLAGTAVAGLYIVQSVAIQSNGAVPDMGEFEMGLLGGTPWMFGEIGLGLGAGAWTVAVITAYNLAERLFGAARIAFVASAIVLALLTVNVQTLHLLPFLLGVFVVACQLAIYRSSGLLAALIANLSSLMFFASIVGLNLKNDRFVNHSLAIAAFPTLLLLSSWLIYQGKQRWPSTDRGARL